MRKHSDNYYEKAYTSETETRTTDRSRIGKALNFASREAYKHLRTNLDFSLADVSGCRCVGLTSPMRGDGKSLTSINLGYSLAEDGYKVILVEGDLRIPSLGKKLGFKQEKGLSNILSEDGPITSVKPSCIYQDREGYFDIMTAGDIPPNPQELLGSARMVEFVEFLKKIYDYVILDLPPVTVVADALVASKVLDGMLLIIRHNHSEKGALSEAVRSMEFAGIRICGFVFNAADNDDTGYTKRYKYRYRYYRTGYRKDYGYYQNSYYTSDRNSVNVKTNDSENHSHRKEEESDRHTHTLDTGN